MTKRNKNRMKNKLMFDDDGNNRCKQYGRYEKNGTKHYVWRSLTPIAGLWQDQQQFFFSSFPSLYFFC